MTDVLRRVSRRRVGMSLATALVSALLLPVGAGPGWAEDPPVNPSDQQIEQARANREAQAQEVGRLAGLVAGAEAEIGALQIKAENAASEYEMAQGALEQARVTAEQTAADVEAAATGVDEATADLASFARSSYIQGSTLDNDFVLLDSAGPAELIERAGLLDALSDSRLDVVSRMELARTRKANADSAQRAAVQQREAAEQRAADSLAAAQATLDSSQVRLGQLQAERGRYETQLRVAQEQLLGVEQARAVYEEYERQRLEQERIERERAEEQARLNREAEQRARDAAAREEAARRAAAPPVDDDPVVAPDPDPAPDPAPVDPGPPPGGGGGGTPSGDWVSPSSGYITSCYCMRWGEMHWGYDFGAPMYDPIYAVGPGTVMRAGEASGFGQAIYIQHDNGDVTVYGHEEVILVSAGERVYPGQLIAKVGTRGFSTGPHLHFEVTDGMYGPRMDPGPWLAARGVSCDSYCR